ncbi:MAG: hypothetical protein ACOCZU_06330 [Planctomycetota bacterium]
MRGENEMDTASRHRTISIIMFAVLVASVLAAWGLTLTSGRLTRNGGKVMAALKEEGADAFWSPGREHWTITTQSGKPIAWSYYAHRRDTDGTYRGIEVTIRRIGDHRDGHWSTWQLSNHLDSSLYNAGRVNILPNSVTLTSDTTTTFKDGSIHLNQRVENSRLKSQAGAGDNYIPEGSLPLVMAMVARQKAEAKFEIIYDYQPPKDGVIQFHKIVMDHRGPSDQIEGGKEIAWRAVGGKGGAAVYVIDSGGFTLYRRIGNEIERQATRQDVLRTFRLSDAILRSVLQEAPDHWPQPEVPMDPNELVEDALESGSHDE